MSLPRRHWLDETVGPDARLALLRHAGSQWAVVQALAKSTGQDEVLLAQELGVRQEEYDPRLAPVVLAMLQTLALTKAQSQIKVTVKSEPALPRLRVSAQAISRPCPSCKRPFTDCRCLPQSPTFTKVPGGVEASFGPGWDQAAIRRWRNLVTG